MLFVFPPACVPYFMSACTKSVLARLATSRPHREERGKNRLDHNNFHDNFTQSSHRCEMGILLAESHPYPAPRR